MMQDKVVTEEQRRPLLSQRRPQLRLSITQAAQTAAGKVPGRAQRSIPLVLPKRVVSRLLQLLIDLIEEDVVTGDERGDALGCWHDASSTLLEQRPAIGMIAKYAKPATGRGCAVTEVIWSNRPVPTQARPLESEAVFGP
jgi:hypothetical protein